MKSMTGYGKALGELTGKRITVEIRSLNSKALDLNLRIPNEYRQKEHELRSLIAKSVERGKVEINFNVEATDNNNTSSINKSLAKQHHSELLKLAKELKVKDTDNLLPLVLKMPEVLGGKKQTKSLGEKEWKQTKVLINKSLQAFQKFRTDEGRSLAKDLQVRIKTIDKLLNKVASADTTRINRIKKRIKNNISEVVTDRKIDQNRLEQELIYYIEKIDITEEKVRLKTHLDYFISTMKEDSTGRKLGFIGQEIGREINTIGSKANDVKIQKLVVQMKDELEKVKEQLLNVL